MLTAEYKDQLEQLHGTGKFGVVGERYGKFVSGIVDQLEIDHLLDYGCGSNLSLTRTLKPERKFTYQGYDPAVPEYAGEPVPAEMVCCIDVLEHIEPQYLETVLDHLESLTEVILFATVHTGPAGKTLPDGRNAHLIQQPMSWWLPLFWDRFEIQTVQAEPQGFWVLAHNQKLEIETDEQPSLLSTPLVT